MGFLSPRLLCLLFGLSVFVESGVSMSYGGTNTYADFQHELKRSLPGGTHSINIKRSNIDTEIIREYNRRNFAYKRTININFVGEDGYDMGGPTKEFFWQGLSKLLEGTVPGTYNLYFVGQEDHKFPNPNVDPSVYTAIGRFMMEAALFQDVGFPGLSPAVYQYMMSSDMDDPKNLELSALDLDDYEDVEALEDLNNYELMTGESTEDLRKDLLYYNVIDNRLPQLKALRDAYRASPFAQRSMSPAFTKKVFPRMNDLMHTADEVIQKITVSQSYISTYPTLKEDLFEIIREQYLQEPAWIKKLLQLWTGSAILSSNTQLVFEKSHYESVKVATCFNQISIPYAVNDKETLEMVLIAAVDSPLEFNTAK